MSATAKAQLLPESPFEPLPLGDWVDPITNLPLLPAGDSPGWRVTARDFVSTTHETTETVTDPTTGQVINRVHQYMEIGSGFNYLDSSGQWAASQDLIELTPNGGAAAMHGPMKVRFNANLNTASAITLTTASNQVMRTRPLCLGYYDAGAGKAVILSQLKDCVGELLPPNQVVYKSAFATLADVRYTYTRAAFESDVIFLEQPLPPEHYGLDPKTTRLEVWHEWLEAPQPQVTGRMLARETDAVLRSQMVEPDFMDQILNFGELWFPTGGAYLTDGSTRSMNTAAQVRVPSLGRDEGLAPVAKTWLNTSSQHRGVLVEGVRWIEIQPKLQRLPVTSLADSVCESYDRLECLGRMALSSNDQQTEALIEEARVAYSPNGLVLDYIIGVSGAWDFMFLDYASGTGPTYWVRSSTYFSGTLTFQPGCIIKFDPGTYLLTFGAIACNGSTNSPSILTSRDDDRFGDTLPLSTHNPSYAAAPAIWDYFTPYGSSFHGLKIRWAYLGIQLDSYAGGSVWDSNFEFCETGVYGSYGGSVIANVCSVETPYSPTDALSGYITDICNGDADQNGFPDIWEYRYMGHTGVQPNGDFDGDCVTNLLEYQLSTNPSDFPSITVPPVYQMLPIGGNASFYAAASQGCVSYQWYRNYSILVDGATSQFLTLNNVQLTHNGVIRIKAYSAAGATYAETKLVVLDAAAWAIWTYFQANSVGKTNNLWDTPQPPYYNMPPGEPPTFTWNTNCLLYGKTGFTALSPFNEWGGKDSGVTAVTKRHGYMRGHGVGPWHFNNTDPTFIGKRVWFYTADNQPVPRTVAAMFNRAHDVTNKTDLEDYTILIFTEDLPESITPVSVMLTPTSPGTVGVLFSTSQFGYMSANMNYPAPFGCYGFSCVDGGDASRPPFNELSTYVGGDSGRPDLIPMTDGQLVFVKARSTTGPCGQMQGDMNVLTQSLGLLTNSYQLSWYPVPD